MQKFDLETYQQLLLMLKERAVLFVTFGKIAGSGVLLRFDVDYDVGWAVQIARINAENNVSGTFFVLVNSPFYNLLSPACLKALKEINDCGQSIGLHYWHVSGELDKNRVVAEFEVLKMLIPQAKKVVAWHNPLPDLSRLNQIVEGLGFVCAYSSTFFGQGRYISDSNCQRGYNEISDFLKNKSDILVQILLHPLNWVIGGNSMEDVLTRTFSRKLDHIGDAFTDNRVWQGGVGKKIVSQLSECGFYNDSSNR